jgi:hypothetical protein
MKQEKDAVIAHRDGASKELVFLVDRLRISQQEIKESNAQNNRASKELVFLVDRLKIS